MSGLLKVFILCICIGQVYCGEEVCHPHYCISGQAECHGNSTCVCNNPPYSWGKGNFACYQHNRVAAEVKNDPELTTFNNESVKFQTPCRYLLTSVKLELKKRGGDRLGFCYFNVHAFHKRINGKIVVDGVEIAMNFDLGYHNVKTLSVITYGQNGHVTEGGTDDEFVENGHYGDDLTSGPVIYSDPGHSFNVKRYFDEHNRQYVFEVENCGFRTTFVPFDVHEGIRSPFIPGISIAINCAFHPLWQLTDTVMALPPHKNDIPTITSIAHHLHLTREQAAVYRAFTADVPQNHPGSCSICSEVADVLHKCDSSELTTAFDRCYWILDSPRFIKCISPDYPNTSSNEHLTFFATCVDHYCDGHHRCRDLRRTHCQSSQLNHIISETCSYA